MSRFISAFTAAIGVLSLAVGPAQAVVIQYSLSGDTEAVAMSNGLDATVTLDPYADSIDLTPGVAQTLLINPGEVDVFQGSNASGSDTLSQTLIVQTGGSQAIAQAVSVFTSAGSPPFEPASADASISAGSPVTFALSGGEYELTVTPLGGVRNGQTTTTFPIFNNAEFLLTAVPEPGSGMVVIAGAALAFARRSRRR